MQFKPKRPKRVCIPILTFFELSSKRALSWSERERACVNAVLWVGPIFTAVFPDLARFFLLFTMYSQSRIYTVYVCYEHIKYKCIL